MLSSLLGRNNVKYKIKEKSRAIIDNNRISIRYRLIRDRTFLIKKLFKGQNGTHNFNRTINLVFKYKNKL